MAADENKAANGCPRRGRPRLRRTIAGTSESLCYKPYCYPEEEGPDILLQPDEIVDTTYRSGRSGTGRSGRETWCLAQDSVAGSA